MAKKPLQKSGVLGMATNLNQKTNPFVPGHGLYKFQGFRLSEEAAVTKFNGIAKLNASAIDESAFGGTGKITGLFNYFPQNPYTYLATTLAASAAWTDVVWNGSLYCAIASDSRTTLTSTDGVTWVDHALALPGTGYVAIAWNGTTFCAVATTNKAATSTDGVTWVEHSLPVPSAGSWRDVAWDGTVFCAICGTVTLTSQAATSPTGETWTSRAFDVTGDWKAIASDGAGRFLVVDHDSASDSVSISLDHGVTWITYGVLPTGGRWDDIVWAGSFFCAVSSIGTMSASSPDGRGWTAGIMPRGVSKLAWNGTYISTNAVSSASLLSKDGIAWSVLFYPTSGSTCVGSNGSDFVSLTTASTSGAKLDFNNTAGIIATTENSLYKWNGSTFAELTTKLHGYNSVSRFYDAEMLFDTLYLSNGDNFNHKYYGGQVHNQGIAPPGAAPSVGLTAGSLTGVYSYKVTFVNQVLGHESNPSPVSSNVSPSGQGVALTNIPISSDPQVTARNLYRTTAGGGVWLYLTTINDNTTATFNDQTNADTSLTAEVDNFGNGVPPLWRLIELWAGTAFMVEKNSSRVWFSKPNFPNAVDSNDFRDLNPADGTTITGLRVYQNVMVAFKDKSIWNGFGNDRYSYGFDQQVKTVGAVNDACIVEVPIKNVLAFIDPSKRFYFYDGTQVSPAAENIEPILQAVSTSALKKIVGTIHKPTNQCRWVVSNDLIIWYDYVQDKWGTRSISNTISPIIASLLDTDGAEVCYLGGDAGNVWTMDSGNNDDGAALTAEVQDRGHPLTGEASEMDEQKSFQRLITWFDPAPNHGTLQAYAIMDDPKNGTPVLLGNIDVTAVSGQYKVPNFNLIGRRCYIKIVDATTDDPVTIRGWIVYYKNLGRYNAP